MSYIFDALLRSEAERCGSPTAVMTSATQLLERAELQIHRQQDAEVISDEVSWSETRNTEPPSPAASSASSVLTKEIGSTRDSAHAAAEANALLSVPSLQCPVSETSRLVCLTDRESSAAEAFRLLRVRLRHRRKDRHLKTVLVTSTVPQEGKSFVAANLACALGSESAEKVLLVEGDLRRPALSQFFGIGARAGLCQAIRESNGLTSSIYRLVTPDIWFLPAGGSKGDPLEIIQSVTLQSLFTQLVGWFDWIIIDSPPVLPMADTTAWARHADGILLVTRRGVTEKQQLKRGLEALESGKLLGAILNSSDAATGRDYYYYRQEGATAERLKSIPE